MPFRDAAECVIHPAKGPLLRDQRVRAAGEGVQLYGLHIALYTLCHGSSAPA